MKFYWAGILQYVSVFAVSSGFLFFVLILRSGILQLLLLRVWKADSCVEPVIQYSRLSAAFYEKAV